MLFQLIGEGKIATDRFKKLISLLFFLHAACGVAQERVIRPGDAIEIIIPQSEELSTTVVVGPDGMVDFPAMQGLPVDGITLQRFRDVLITQLSRYMESTPLVMVRFSDSFPIRVNVLGQVAQPGLHQIVNTATLQGAIGAAGGFIPGAQLSRIKLLRMENGEQTEKIINMERFYLHGDPSALPQLKDDDTIVVPGNPLATNVKVLGAVENPGSYDVFFQTTLLDVIFLAGGPSPDGNLKKIKIVSLTEQNTRQVPIDIKKLVKAPDYKSIPIVVPGDIVYVPEKKITWSKGMNLLRDLTIFATLFYLISMTQNN